MRSFSSSLKAMETTEVSLSFVERFIVAGAVWEISTNCRETLAMMSEISDRAESGHPVTDLSVFLYVNPELPGREVGFRPYFRALEHLYFGTYGPGDSLLVDQRSRRVVASMSVETAQDAGFWKRVILPCLAGITSACVGLAPVHCACVVKDQFGLLIHGESGSGKSTLALTLSLNGFSYVSDDCTYVSRSKERVQCWGSSAPLKLVPDAIRYFPQLANMEPSESLNGELAYQVDPSAVFGVPRASNCRPRWIIFIERDSHSTPTFRQISSAEAADRLASDLERLPLCIAFQRDHQRAVIEVLAQQQCWHLRHHLQPRALALTISQFCADN
jgi:hypothetical protein